MTFKEICEEIDTHAGGIAKRLYGEDIIDILEYKDICIIIEEYKKVRGDKAHPEMTVEFLYNFVHLLDD